jgi:hypothetical protein
MHAYDAWVRSSIAPSVPPGNAMCALTSHACVCACVCVCVCVCMCVWCPVLCMHGSICCEFKVTKGNQSGFDTVPKHVYANPHKPEVDFNLALGIHLALHPECDESGLVFGKLSSTYNETLAKKLRCDEVTQQLQRLGVNVRRITSHAIRKVRSLACLHDSAHDLLMCG